MSTIVYRDGVIAADTICVRGDARVFHRTKIARSPKGRLGGAAGTMTFCNHFLQWIQSDNPGGPPERMRDEHYADVGFTVSPEGIITIYEFRGEAEVEAPYIAIGSGYTFALGALWTGVPATLAVAAAINFDTASGGIIQYLTREHDFMRELNPQDMSHLDDPTTLIAPRT